MTGLHPGLEAVDASGGINHVGSGLRRLSKPEDLHLRGLQEFWLIGCAGLLSLLFSMRWSAFFSGSSWSSWAGRPALGFGTQRGFG